MADARRSAISLDQHVFQANRERLVAYATQILKDRSRAEDVVQDIWLQLTERPPEQQVHAALPFLMRTVRNRAIDALRARMREQRLGSEPLPDESIGLADRSPSAETALIARQTLACLSATLAELPARQRRAIELHRLEGLKLREISERLGLSIPMVHHLISEGLAICAKKCLA